MVIPLARIEKLAQDLKETQEINERLGCYLRGAALQEALEMILEVIKEQQDATQEAALHE